MLGAALWMLGDTRARTLAAAAGVTDRAVDAVPPGLPNTIGSLLYHIAAIEADWLYADILGEEYPDWMEAVFPHDVREEDGRLTPVLGETLQSHLERMASVRERFLADIRAVSDDDFVRVRETVSGMVSPQWVLHHLGQHEGEHRGQLQSAVTALSASGS
jgi:uncharacterized damage-inducible protein DinB